MVIMFDPTEGTRPLANTAQPPQVNNWLPARVLIEPPNIALMSDSTLGAYEADPICIVDYATTCVADAACVAECATACIPV